MHVTQQLPGIVRPVSNCQSSNKVKTAQVKTPQKTPQTVPLSDQYLLLLPSNKAKVVFTGLPVNISSAIFTLKKLGGTGDRKDRVLLREVNFHLSSLPNP